MSIDFSLETLTRQHSIADFHCGDADEEKDIAEYLRDVALNDMAKGLAWTFVLLDHRKATTGKNVAGFLTLRAHSERINEHFFADFEDFDEENAIDDLEVPLIELMYLARDSEWEGQGIGDVLMAELLNQVAHAADHIGFIGMHLRSTRKGKRLYERYPFQIFEAHPRSDGYRYIISVRDIRNIAAVIRQLEAQENSEDGDGNSGEN